MKKKHVLESVHALAIFVEHHFAAHDSEKNYKGASGLVR
jgi:hypothetical protein